MTLAEKIVWTAALVVSLIVDFVLLLILLPNILGLAILGISGAYTFWIINSFWSTESE